jgi:hypothetical protein
MNCLHPELPQTKSEIVQRAYAKLGVRQRDLSQTMEITPEIERIFKQLQRVDINTMKDTTDLFPTDVYYYLRASDSEDARKVLNSYYSLPKYLRTELPIEAFCLAAGVPALRILEVVTAVCVRIGATASQVIAAVSHPRVVEATVEMALTPDGHDDRSDLHKATGFLPTPRGNKTQINISQNASATSDANAQFAVVAAPPPEQTIRRLVDRFNDARQMASQAPAQLPEPRANNLEAFNNRQSPVAVELDDGYEE